MQPLRFIPLAAVLAALLVAGTGFAPAGQPAADTEPPTIPAPEPDRLTRAVVIEVIDGDSLVLIADGQLRRYEVMGADAPEWLERARRQRPYAEEARRFLTNMLAGEQVAVLEPEPPQVDPLGRRRASIYRLPDMTLVDLEIVRQGYGRVSTRAPEEHADFLRWYESRARELGRGLWAEPADPDEAEAPTDPEEATETPKPTPVVRAPAAEPEPPQQQPAETDGYVWVTKSGSKYHQENCSHLTSSRTRVSRESVRSTHEPCKSCNPG